MRPQGANRRDRGIATAVLGGLWVAIAATSGSLGRGRSDGPATATPIRRVGMRLVGVLCAAASVMAIHATSASATLVHPYLSSFGSFSNIVRGVAIDQSTGDVYVYDSTAKAIFKFDAAGNPVEFTATKTNELTGLPTAAIGRGELAVDNSSGPAKGDIYVAHGGSNILIYDAAGAKIGELTGGAGVPWNTATSGVAVDPEGNVYVGVYAFAGDVDKYTPTANPVTNGGYVASFGAKSPGNLAVDSEGDVFAAALTKGPVTRYESSQFGSSSATGSVVDEAGTTLAVDPAGNEVYVDEQNQVSQFGKFGKPFEEPIVVFAGSGEGAISGSQGIAVSSTSGEVYVSNGKGAISVFGPAVMRPTVVTGRASDLTGQTATISGEVNPEGIPLEECYFEYGETTAYESTAPCAPEASQIGAGKTSVKVRAALTGLTAGVTYHYRLVASNLNGTAQAEDATFEFVPPAIEGEHSVDVTASSATIGASLDPNGSITEYWFEYGLTDSYTSRTPALDTAEGTAFELVQAHLQELAAETTYHYRLVASSSAGPTQGPDEAFTTQGPGGPLTLLDGRQWELVSPSLKYGAGIIGLREGGDVVQASASGDAITYVAKNPIEAEPEGNSAPEASQIMARRASGGGWVNRTLDTANEDVHQLPVGDGLEYKAFSEDLSRAILQPYGTTPLSSSATKERAPYLREEAACNEGSSSCFTPFLTRANTMPGAEWDPNPPDAVPGLLLKVNFEGATPDLSHSVFSSEVKLLEDGGEPSMYSSIKRALYEWSSDGQLQFVDINAAGESVTGEFVGPRNGISNDGSRIIWCEERCSRKPLLMRDTATEETLTIATGAVGHEVTFQAANATDSKIFYTVAPAFNERQLWECEVLEVAGKLECVATEIAPETLGATLGVGSEASTIYFVSTAVLAGEAVAGSDNLYVANLEGGKWEPRFIAALSSEDANDWTTDLEHMVAKASPDGRYLAFMSDRSLTGYDNHDAVSGVADQEVFLYDDQTAKLACASCDPTGARPDGKYLFFDDRTLVNPQNIWRGIWVAASVPGWDNISLSESSRQLRYLSDEGQLFFDSSDGLVPQDTNGLEDVYEYEPEGAGICMRAAGCVNLISSGTAGDESVFLEASVSGNDVFFITTAQLTPQDSDTAFDVYDARVCTAQLPCAQAPVSPPPCSSGEGCKPAQTPQPSIYGAPASATFSGAGDPARKANATAGSSKPQGKKGKARRRLQRALRKCRRKDRGNAGKKRRCEAAARKRYRASAKRSTKTKSREARTAPAQASQNERGR